MNRRPMLVNVAGAAALLVTACAEPADTPGQDRGPGRVGGTIAIAASADADNLLPPLTFSIQGKQISDQIFDNLADVGEKLNTVGDRGFSPRLAQRWSWSADSTAIDFHLDPRARWHDGAPVRAEDVRFTLALLKNPALGSPLAGNVEDVDSVSTPDSLTARVWLKRRGPDSFFKIAAPIAILPSHLLRELKPDAIRGSGFAQKPIGSGRFRFSAWDRGSRIVLTADSANYRGRPNTDRVIWLVSPDYAAAALRFLSGEADFIDVVRPEYLARVREKGLRVVTTSGSLDYGYVGFNLRNKGGSQPHPVLGDRDVRRALVMSVDRAALVRNVFDTLGLVARGPATRVLPTSDTTLGPPYDTVAAGRMLDSLGWRRGGDGLRSRRGTPLRFSLMVPSSSATRMKLAVLLQEQWRKAGAEVRVEPLEVNTFGAQMDARKFDSFLNAWHIDPNPASVREEWTTAQAAKGGYNVTNYRNPLFDAVIDSAAAEKDAGRSIVLYRRGYRILTDDAPGLWLYELRNAFGISKRLEPGPIRADAWWSSLGNWRVTAARQ
ncbi:MAG: peptide ABC transporter substrate-binding protein [Gemmatimonadaceae bacterium]|nr:peptide ABC transporter substrate-binding protein [Gemmatimonadaceae bacterium]